MAHNVHYVNQPIERYQALSLKSPDAGKPRNFIARRKNGKIVVLQGVRGFRLLRNAKFGGRYHNLIRRFNTATEYFLNKVDIIRQLGKKTCT
jgi:hypothetical protein